MATNLSYSEAVSKGLVYPGQESSALKLTGGGKGFASTESFKQAFESTYEQEKQKISSYQPLIKSEQKKIDKIIADREAAEKARNEWQGAYNSTQANRFRWRDSQFAAAGAAMGRAQSKYNAIMTSYGVEPRGKGINIGYYDDNKFTEFFNSQVRSQNKAIEDLVAKRKSQSDIMEKAIGKYKAATKEAVTVEKRETGAASAARKRLTRGTAGLLAKAGGAGGMVGTGLPMLGEGTAPALGETSQLGRKVTL